MIQYVAGGLFEICRQVLVYRQRNGYYNEIKRVEYKENLFYMFSMYLNTIHIKNSKQQYDILKLDAI